MLEIEFSSQRLVELTLLFCNDVEEHEFPSRGGTHDIFALSGIFDEKVGPFSEFLCPMEVSKIRF